LNLVLFYLELAGLAENNLVTIVTYT